jgi:hypothetical protein
MSTVWVQRVLGIHFSQYGAHMRCTQIPVHAVLHLQSHAVLKTYRAVQSPTRTSRTDMDMRGPRVRAHAGPLPQQRTEYTQTGRHRYPRGRRTGIHTDPRPRLPEYIHAFPRPVSISHVQPYTESAAGRPDPDTRQRAVGYDTADRRIACLPCCLHSSGVVEHPHAPGRGQMLQVLHATIVPGQTRETGGAS